MDSPRRTYELLIKGKTMSTFLPNIPQGGDFIDFSWTQLLANNQQLDTSFGIDHYTFSNATANNGKHAKCTFPEQAAGPTTAANEGALYTKDVSGITQLFWRAESNGLESQLTNLTPITTANGRTFLPGGLLFQWGIVAQNTSQTNAVVFTTAFTTLLNIQVTAKRATNNSGITVDCYIQGQTTAGFNIINSSSSSTSLGYYWMAIGLA